MNIIVLATNSFNEIKSILKNGFAHIFVGTFLNKAIAMISSVIIARVVDKTEYAYLSYSETLYGYLLLFASLGMSSALLKVCSGNHIGRQDKAYLLYAVKWGTIFEVCISLCLIVICLIVKLPFPEAKLYIVSTILYPAIYSIYDTLISYIRAKKRNILFAKINVVYAILTCLLSIGLVLWIDALGVIIARYLVLVLIVSFIAFYITRIFKDKEIQQGIGKNEKRIFLSMSLSLMAANVLSGMMPINENLLISNIIADETTTANFRVAGLFPQLLILVSQAIMIYFFPIVAEMDNNNVNRLMIKKYILKIEVLNFSLVFIAIAIGVILTPFLIKFFYSSKYEDAIPIAYILWGMRGINAAIRIVPMNMLIAIRKYNFNLIMSAFSAFIQLVADWYFIKTYGIMGVAYGTVIVYALTGVVYWTYLLKSLK